MKRKQINVLSGIFPVGARDIKAFSADSVDQSFSMHIGSITN